MEAANAASAVVEQQSQQKQVTSQKSQKKKSKNKKPTGKNCANSSPAVDEVVLAAANHSNTVASANAARNGQQEEESAGTTTTATVAANGLCEQLEHQMHIAGNVYQVNGTHAMHATLNGHHTTAADGDTNKSNGTPQLQLSHLQQSTLTESSGSGNGNGNGNGKKSKSKSNKKNNKEAVRQSHVSNTARMTSNNGETCATSGVKHNFAAGDAAGKAQEAAAMQLENGFSDKQNVNTNAPTGAVSRRSNGTGNSETTALQQAEQAAALGTTEVAAELATHPADQAKAIGTAAAAVVAAVVATATATVSSVMASSTCDAETSQLPAAVTASAHNTNTNANLTATENSNTAKPNDAVNANASATTTTTAQAPVAATPAPTTGTDSTNASALAPTLAPAPALDLSNVHIEYKEYESELQMHDIMRLIQAELSEPYSIYTYRYFIYNWPKLCFLAAHGDEYVGAIVCKLDMHMNVRRGYIAMLAVRKEYRKLKIGTTLVQKAIEAMLADNADEVVLETEMRNVPALRLYENLGFVRDKRLFRYYLNGVDALRLKLWFR